MKRFAAAVVMMLLGVVLAVAGGIVIYARSLPDLAPWHTVELDAEFTEEQVEAVGDLDGYLRLEDRLFEQMKASLMTPVFGIDTQRYHRYSLGSWSDPTRHAVNWNRTVRMIPKSPNAAVLMLHGLSDAPYSMRTLGEAFHSRGAAVVMLRLPGHGTAPAGLTQVDWLDMAAAVRLAARDLDKKIGGQRPFYMVGYSNGAALTVEYCLSMLGGEDVPRPDGVLLLSPALAVSPAAALAKWSRRLSYLPGLEKLAWTDIQPEFDPYKYNSFPVNAGDLIHRLSIRIATLVNRLDSGQGISDFPPVLAVQSVTDATIQWRGIVDGLLLRLTPHNHALLLFDANRQKVYEALYNLAALPDVSPWFSRKLPFSLSLLTNQSPETLQVMVRQKTGQMSQPVDRSLDMAWPKDVFSISHVAVPFAPNDPLYGNTGVTGGTTFSLGALAPRGERGLLEVPEAYFVRLRYNPFFDYMRQQALTHFRFADTVSDPIHAE